MKQCVTCGKELSRFDVFEINNKIQCKECADKEFFEKHKTIQNNDSNEFPIENSHTPNDRKFRQANSTNGWASGMKIITIILLIVLLIFSIVIAFLVGGESDSILLGICVYIGSTVASFAIVGYSMSFLQLSEDVSYIKNIMKNSFEDD